MSAQRAATGLEESLDEAALLLKMLRPQEQSFRPDDFVVGGHRVSYHAERQRHHSALKETLARSAATFMVFFFAMAARPLSCEPISARQEALRMSRYAAATPTNRASSDN